MFSQPRLKLYSDRAYLPAGLPHVTMLIPFWGPNTEVMPEIQTGRFDEYATVGNQFFEMSSLEDADLAVLPCDWDIVTEEHMPLINEFAAKVAKVGKPLVVFLWGPSLEPIPLPNAMVFRNSYLRSQRERGTFCLPYWNEDMLKVYFNGKLSIRPKQDKPTVSFCGFAEPLHPSMKDKVKVFLQKIRAVIRGQVGKKSAGVFGRAVRSAAMRNLDKRSDLVKTSFIIHDHFWAGAIRPDNSYDRQRLLDSRIQYVNNVVNSDYVLVVRGAGNNSFRMYETICCGRIPVFINTDSPLPYDFAVDWKKYCVWVEQDEVDHISQKVADFHAKLSPAEFEQLQADCRKLWEEYISPVGFFQHFYMHLEHM